MPLKIGTDLNISRIAIQGFECLVPPEEVKPINEIRNEKSMKFAPSNLRWMDRIVLVLTLIVVLIIAAGGLHYTLSSKDINTNIQKEDGIIENLTVLFFGGAGVMFIYAMVSTHAGVKEKLRDYRLVIILLGVLCIFAALEEISFGQRLIGWDSPEYFEEHSTQKETDFHNFPAISVVFGILAACLVLYGVVVPFGLHYYQNRFNRFREILGIRILYPPVPAAIVFGAGILCIVLDYLTLFVAGERFVTNEYEEFFFGYGFIIFSLYLFDKRFQSRVIF